MKVRPKNLPRCSTSASDCRRDTAASSTSSWASAPSAIRSNEFSSCGVSSSAAIFLLQAEGPQWSLSVQLCLKRKGVHRRGPLTGEQDTGLAVHRCEHQRSETVAVGGRRIVGTKTGKTTWGLLASLG